MFAKMYKPSGLVSVSCLTLVAVLVSVTFALDQGAVGVRHAAGNDAELRLSYCADPKA